MFSLKSCVLWAHTWKVGQREMSEAWGTWLFPENQHHNSGDDSIFNEFWRKLTCYEWSAHVKNSDRRLWRIEWSSFCDLCSAWKSNYCKMHIMSFIANLQLVDLLDFIERRHYLLVSILFSWSVLPRFPLCTCIHATKYSITDLHYKLLL